MENWPILSIITFTPLIGVLFVLLINAEDEIGRRNIKLVAALYVFKRELIWKIGQY